MSKGKNDRTASETAAVRRPPSASNTSHAGLCIQEWTGGEWIVVEALNCPIGYTCQPLDVGQIQGQYLGHRVITPAVPDASPLSHA